MNDVITVSGLTKYYGKARGVENLNFEVKQGEIFGFLGPNGAGKTTTMRLLLHLLKPSSGQAQILGYPITGKNYPRYLFNIGYLPGDLELYRRLTGKEMLKFAASFYHKNYAQYSQQLVDWLECQMDKPYAKLSRGNKQKIGILLALFHNPQLLILDEPTNGLDPITQNKFYQLLLQLKQNGTTILFSSHNLPEVEKVCDRVGIIKNGNLIKVETLDELRRRRTKVAEVFFKGGYDPGAFQLLNGVEILEQESDYLRLNVSTEDLNELMRALSKYEISDVNFSNPDLEEIFLTYY